MHIYLYVDVHITPSCILCMFVSWLCIITSWTRKCRLTVKKCDASTSDQEHKWTLELEEKSEGVYKYVDANDFMMFRFGNHKDELKQRMETLRSEAAEMLGKESVWPQLTQVHVTSYGCLGYKRLYMI